MRGVPRTLPGKGVIRAMSASSSAYAAAAARISLALIVREASAPDPRELEKEVRTFSSIEQSASEVLLDIYTRHMRTVGARASAAAARAGRSEANLVDMLAATGTDSRALLEFLEDEAKEVAFPCNLAAFPVRTPPAPPPVNAAASRTEVEPRPSHVPDFLPPFPERRTYQRTATHNVRPHDGPAAKKRRSQHRRQAQESLLGLRVRAQGAEADGGSGECAEAPPPLPSLEGLREVAADDEMDGGADGGGAGRRPAATGAAAMRRVPDVLAPGLAAVLPSSEQADASGLRGVSQQQPRQRQRQQQADAAVDGANGGTVSSKEQAILQLAHTQGLLSYGTSRGRGSRSPSPQRGG